MMPWKHAFLDLEDVLEDFMKKWLINTLDLVPPEDDPDQNNVRILLLYHLMRTKELLWLEINGGLEDQYQEEVDGIKTRKASRCDKFSLSEFEWLKMVMEAYKDDGKKE